MNVGFPGDQILGFTCQTGTLATESSLGHCVSHLLLLLTLHSCHLPCCFTWDPLPNDLACIKRLPRSLVRALSPSFPNWSNQAINISFLFGYMSMEPRISSGWPDFYNLSLITWNWKMNQQYPRLGDSNVLAAALQAPWNLLCLDLNLVITWYQELGLVVNWKTLLQSRMLVGCFSPFFVCVFFNPWCETK